MDTSSSNFSRTWLLRIENIQERNEAMRKFNVHTVTISVMINYCFQYFIWKVRKEQITTNLDLKKYLLLEMWFG